MTLRINRIEIANFRSIQTMSLAPHEACLVLVGINESGKTNILHALSLLDPQREVSVHDIREPHPDEPKNESKVRFIFDVGEAVLDEIASDLEGSILVGRDEPIAEVANQRLTF